MDGFFPLTPNAAGSNPRGARQGFRAVAASLRSDLRLRTQGSPIQLAREKSPSDFLSFASCPHWLPNQNQCRARV
jgi:hypothetical protein